MLGSRYMISLGGKLGLDDVVAVAYGAKVSIPPKVKSLLDSRRKEIEKAIKGSDAPLYGFNRGFGHNATKKVPPSLTSKLQENLIRSHSSGVGPPAAREIVRATMVLRAQSLSLGASGVRAAVVEKLVELLNKNVTPVVPLFGSVGASGDLAPLSHIALAVIGEGEVLLPGGASPVATEAAFRKLKIKPLPLEMKEGLALNNGVQFSTAFGILTYDKLSKMIDAACGISAIAAQVLLGSDVPFRKEIHALRPHPGAVHVAEVISSLMKSSPLRESHRDADIDGEVQDPYSLRCTPQILGTAYDLIEEARVTFEREINSVTDNPIVLHSGKKPEVVSGGNFHGMPIAVKIYNLIQAMGILVGLSNTRAARLVDENRNRGLGSDLIWPLLSEDEKHASSGFMVSEYVSASVTNFVLGSSLPSHLFSIVTDAGQEDHVSMSAGLGVRAWATLPRVAEVLGCELFMCAQAAAIRKARRKFPTKRTFPVELLESEEFMPLQALREELKKSGFDINPEVGLLFEYDKKYSALSPACEKILSHVYERCQPVEEDRPLSDEISGLASMILDGTLSSLVNQGSRSKGSAPRGKAR